MIRQNRIQSYRLKRVGYWAYHTALVGMLLSLFQFVPLRSGANHAPKSLFRSTVTADLSLSREVVSVDLVSSDPQHRGAN